MNTNTVRRRVALLTSHISPPKHPPLPDCILASNYTNSICDDNHMKNAKSNTCVFCQIIAGEAPALKIYEDDECLCILDRYPLCHGHALILPKRHFPSLSGTPPPIIAAMCSKVPLISNAVMKATGCDSFNLLVNNGAAAGQVIYHTHIHIIPRNAKDCLWTSESLLRRPLKLDQEASEIANSIRENLSCANDCENGKGQDSGVIESSER